MERDRGHSGAEKQIASPITSGVDQFIYLRREIRGRSIEQGGSSTRGVDSQRCLPPYEVNAFDALVCFGQRYVANQTVIEHSGRFNVRADSEMM